jgi:Cu(I)/Ag(I) efflux system membrane protein CusA/SilA
MVPMSIPTFGGMLIQTMTMFVSACIPVLVARKRSKREERRAAPDPDNVSIPNA